MRYAGAVLDFATCDAARLRRDPAYDGVFFIAVRTTMIYTHVMGKGALGMMSPLDRSLDGG